MDTRLAELRAFAEANGGITAVASSIGVTKGVFWAWLNRGRVPGERCHAVEKVTGVRRWHLRPDDWWRLWPELIGAEGAPPVPTETKEVA